MINSNAILNSTPAKPPIIIASAPNGAYKLKTDHASIPLTRTEIVDCAEQVCDAGATMFHLHVRDESGQHSINANRYLNTIEAIHKQIDHDLLIQITSESGQRYSPEQQFATIRAVEPESVSIAIREVLPTSKIDKFAMRFFDWLSGQTIAPQYILYDAEDLQRFQNLLERQIIPVRSISVLFVLGRYKKGQISDPSDLKPFLSAFELHPTAWMTCAFGPEELNCTLASAQQGGHIRIGFENNLHLQGGQTAENNTALIQQAATALKKAGHQLANIEQTRGLLL